MSGRGLYADIEERVPLNHSDFANAELEAGTHGELAPTKDVDLDAEPTFDRNKTVPYRQIAIALFISLSVLGTSMYHGVHQVKHDEPKRYDLGKRVKAAEFKQSQAKLDRLKKSYEATKGNMSIEKRTKLYQDMQELKKVVRSSMEQSTGSKSALVAVKERANQKTQLFTKKAKRQDKISMEANAKKSNIKLKTKPSNLKAKAYSDIAPDDEQDFDVGELQRTPSGPDGNIEVLAGKDLETSCGTHALVGFNLENVKQEDGSNRIVHDYYCDDSENTLDSQEFVYTDWFENSVGLTVPALAHFTVDCSNVGIN